MNDHAVLTLRLAALVVASATLSGCMHALFAVASPTMNAAMEASLTPEAVGITTSTWRGKSCSQLETSHTHMSEQQQKSAATGDTSMAKINGWQVDAINQVRREQGCLGGPATVPSSGQVTAYGYCFSVSETVNYLTPMFTYRDFYSDYGAAETAAFNEMLRSTYGVEDGRGACLMEDSPANAAAAIERSANVTRLQMDWDTVHVPWTPPPIEKAAKSTAAPVSSASASGGSTDSVSMGLALESPSADLVSALDLPSTTGAWVVSVAPGSVAAKAGVKPMDVILDLSGQLVSQPTDVMTIAGKLRPGYKAPLRVWRNRTNHELVLAIPEGLSASVSNAKTGAVAPAVTASVATEAPQVQQSANTAGAYCTAQLFTQDAYGSTVSPAKLIAGAAGDKQPSLMGYIAHAKQTQPGVWGDFHTVACAADAVICVAEALGPTGKIQKAYEFCYATLAEADDLSKEMREADPQAVVIDWP